MNHAGEGLLQAYIDGEVTGEAEAELVAHVGACAACGEELKELRAASATFEGAMALMSGAPDVRSAHARILRTHKAAAAPLSAKPASITRFAAGGLARAAALVLLVAAGAAAMIPGSPLRKWIGQGLDRMGLLSPRTETAPPPVTPPPAVERVLVPGAEMSITPVNGAVRIYVTTTPGTGRLTVRLVDAALATVQTDSSAHSVTFRNASGRMDIMNLGQSDAEIRLPRALRSAVIEVNGTQYFVKEQDQLRVTGPTSRRTSDEIVFLTGS
jgi:hypothetical protein